jgi:hypothetical protein
MCDAAKCAVLREVATPCVAAAALRRLRCLLDEARAQSAAYASNSSSFKSSGRPRAKMLALEGLATAVVMPVQIHTQAVRLLAQLLLLVCQNRNQLASHEQRQNHDAT